MVYGNDDDQERALPLYLKLCAAWPADAVGFANACDCLMKLGRWTDAELVLESAPDCYQQFQLYHRQRENLRSHTLNSPVSKTVPFRGQRGLGGLLILGSIEYEQAIE
jgi:Tetratricopeptide repeat